MQQSLHSPLPYMLIILGILASLVIQNSLAIGSGVLAISAGAALLLGRRFADKPRRSRPVAAQRRSCGGANLVWNKKLECGNSGIDEQHKKLITIGNQLLDAIENKRTRAHLNSLIDKLIAEVKAHFRSEETLLAAWNHPITAEHKSAHEDLLKKAAELRRASQRGKLSQKIVARFLVEELVHKHIALGDRVFFHEI